MVDTRIRAIARRPEVMNVAAFIAAFLVFLLAVAGLALGVLLGRAPLRGSCGGLRRVTTEPCACERPCPRKQRELDRQEARRTVT